jgi:hypothetical protein
MLGLWTNESRGFTLQRVDRAKPLPQSRRPRRGLDWEYKAKVLSLRDIKDWMRNE